MPDVLVHREEREANKDRIIEMSWKLKEMLSSIVNFAVHTSLEIIAATYNDYHFIASVFLSSLILSKLNPKISPKT